MIRIIVCIDAYNNMCVNDKIYWHNAEDLQSFKKDTLDTILIVGHRTFKTFKEPLKDRIHIVVTRTPEKYNDTDNVKYRNFEDAFKLAKTYNKDISVIGGGQIYDLALKSNYIDQIVLSQVECIPTEFKYKEVLGNRYYELKKFWVPYSFKRKQRINYKTFKKYIYELSNK